jgi:hypothetical protein
MSWFFRKSCQGLVIGGAAFAAYTYGLKFQYELQYSKVEDARQKTTNGPNKTRIEMLKELKKRKEYDLVIIGTCSCLNLLPSLVALIV